MEGYGLIIIFWYGILHAFGPDHLTAIADFSIGKSKRKTFLITFFFAIGHGLMLLAFANILENIQIPAYILNYGDLISASVIISMGLYLLYMALSNKIYLHTHEHNGQKHIHISFNKNHEHNSKDTKQAFSLGALMGIGGVRGMLVSIALIQQHSVDSNMVIAFALGVMVIFIGFGFVINFINTNFLNSEKNIKIIFATTGIISFLVGTNILFA